MSYSTGSHTVFYHRYHIVWITKYRYKVLQGKLRERVRDIIRQVCREMGVQIIEGVLSSAVLARACISERLASHRAQPDCVVEFAVRQQSSISRRSKSSLRTPFFDSPVGCAMTASLNPE
jgi:putative transposase